MILWNSGPGCEEARGYYYDWIDGQCQEEIPQGIQMHVGHCDHCQEEIHRLGEVLKSPSTSNPEAVSRASMINAMLEMHFKYAEMPVTCAVAKRFLPSMAGWGTTIAIPTPITVHIEQCSRCRNDWLELQSLDLSDVQLQRLTECIERGGVQTPLGRHTHLTYEQVQTFARLDYADFDTACLEHVCECVSCRERALLFRQTAASQVIDEPQTCEEVSWEDLFDLAMPVGFNPLVDGHDQYRTATVAHVGGCGNCQRRLGQLDQILINFLSPNEGGVVTHFRLALDEAPSLAHAEYGDYPIRVEVQDAPAQALASVSDQVNAVSGPRPAHARFGWTKVAAAVVVLLGVTIFSVMPHAEAGFLDPVYISTTDAPIVHFKVYPGGGSQVSGEYFIKPPNRAVVFEGQTWTDYNVSAGWYRIMDAEGRVTTIPLETDTKKAMQRRIRGLFDLWPLEASDEAVLTSTEQDRFDVHELEWYRGMTTFVWRADVDRVTNRVVRVERSDNDLDVTQSFEVDYPSVSKTKAILQQRSIELTGF